MHVLHKHRIKRNRRVKKGNSIAKLACIHAKAVSPALLVKADTSHKQRTGYSSVMDYAEQVLHQYIGNISHEFLSPLSSIQGYAQMLQQDHLKKEERKRYATIISNEVQQLSALSRHILLLSYVQHKPEALNRQVYPIKQQLRQVLQLLEWQMTSKELTVLLNANDQAVVYADQVLMHQVWVNLLTNSIKHEKNGGSISIDVEMVEKQCVVTISDEGDGIEEKQRLFERYYRGAQAKNEAYSGNFGLGLAIVESIITMHEGSIKLNGHKDRGTTVTVALRSHKL